MQRSPWFRRLAALLAFVPVLWVLPPQLVAQDLIFDEEEEIIDSEYLIEEEEVEVLDSSEFGPPLTTGLVIPGDYVDPGTAEYISDLIIDELYNIPNVEPVAYDGLKDEFDIMGAELALECAFDPICLGRVGADVGLDEIIMGRATGRQGGQVQFVLDRVNVESRSVVRYRPARSDDDPASLREMVARQLPYLYDLQEEDGPPPIVAPTGPSKLQIGLAWTSLGLGVVALGLGVAFGVKANSAEDDVVGARILEGGMLELTQIEADQMLADGEDDALLSNVMFGTGLALIGVAVLLFLITPGEDIDVEAERVTRSPRQLPPVGASVTEDGWGIFGQIRF